MPRRILWSFRLDLLVTDRVMVRSVPLSDTVVTLSVAGPVAAYSLRG